MHYIFSLINHYILLCFNHLYAIFIVYIAAFHQNKTYLHIILIYSLIRSVIILLIISYLYDFALYSIIYH